ncbi:MAG: hypothetical protein OEW24_00965 [Chloroflexota bacterium]|nr:hypothetical protein [Chloroflexota bacterium]
MPLIRTVMGAVGAATLLGGLGWALSGHRDDGLVLMAIGAIVVLIALFERARYGREERSIAASASSMRRTDEVFTDPTSGDVMRVWVDPKTGTRDYRRDGD